MRTTDFHIILRQFSRLFNVGERDNETGNVMISGKLDLLSGVNNADKRLQISVISHAPCLQVIKNHYITFPVL